MICREYIDDYEKAVYDLQGGWVDPVTDDSSFDSLKRHLKVTIGASDDFCLGYFDALLKADS